MRGVRTEVREMEDMPLRASSTGRREKEDISEVLRVESLILRTDAVEQRNRNKWMASSQETG